MLDARSDSYAIAQVGHNPASVIRGREETILFHKRPFKAIACAITLVAFIFNTVSYDIAWADRTPSALTSVGADSRAVSPVSPGPVRNVVSNGAGAFKELNVKTFTLPQSLGTIKDAWSSSNPLTRSPANSQTIIHIQDAHCNYYAQHAISGILEYLSKEYGASTINLEGGAKDYDLSIFTSIADKSLRERAADYFLKEGLVNGAEYFALNNPDKASLWGIEDAKLYIDNLKVYRDSLKTKGDTEKLLKNLSHILTNLKMKIYSKELLELDLKYNQYKANSLEFKDYLNYLIANSKDKLVDIKSFPDIFLLNQTLKQEGEIDFRNANNQRDELIDKMQKRLSKNALKELVAKTVEFKAETISQEEFYRYLANKANSADISIENFPELEKYIVYISTYAAIDKSKTIYEVTALENKIREALYQNDRQRELDKLSKNLAILKNIFNISLTRADYQYYKSNETSFDMRNYISFIGREAPLCKITAKLDDGITRLDGYRDQISKFYEYSFKRDEAFIKNLSTKHYPLSTNCPAVVITGGFHTENLCDEFKKQGISYISIIPNFKSSPDYACPYFKILSGTDKTQLIKAVPAMLAANLAPVSQLNPTLYNDVAEVFGEPTITATSAQKTEPSPLSTAVISTQAVSPIATTVVPQIESHVAIDVYPLRMHTKHPNRREFLKGVTGLVGLFLFGNCNMVLGKVAEKVEDVELKTRIMKEIEFLIKNPALGEEYKDVLRKYRSRIEKTPTSELFWDEDDIAAIRPSLTDIEDARFNRRIGILLSQNDMDLVKMAHAVFIKEVSNYLEMKSYDGAVYIYLNNRWEKYFPKLYEDAEKQWKENARNARELVKKNPEAVELIKLYFVSYMNAGEYKAYIRLNENKKVLGLDEKLSRRVRQKYKDKEDIMICVTDVLDGQSELEKDRSGFRFKIITSVMENYFSNPKVFMKDSPEVGFMFDVILADAFGEELKDTKLEDREWALNFTMDPIYYPYDLKELFEKGIAGIKITSDEKYSISGKDKLDKLLEIRLKALIDRRPVTKPTLKEQRKVRMFRIGEVGPEVPSSTQTVVPRALAAGFVAAATVASEPSAPKPVQEPGEEGRVVAGAGGSDNIGKSINNVEQLGPCPDIKFGPSDRYEVKDGILHIGGLDIPVRITNEIKDASGNVISDSGIVVKGKDGKFYSIIRAGPTEQMKDALIHELVACLSLSGAVSAQNEIDAIHQMAKSSENLNVVKAQKDFAEEFGEDAGEILRFVSDSDKEIEPGNIESYRKELIQERQGREIFSHELAIRGLGTIKFYTKHNNRIPVNFSDEAKVMSTLHRKGFGIGAITVDGGKVLAMNKADGESLDKIMEAEGYNPTEKNAGIAEAIMYALGRLHGLRVIHGDIAQFVEPGAVRPGLNSLIKSNIIISEDGKVTFIDFGNAFMEGTKRTPKDTYFGIEMDSVIEVLSQELNVIDDGRKLTEAYNAGKRDAAPSVAAAPSAAAKPETAALLESTATKFITSHPELGLEIFRPIIRELIRKYGNIENMAGLRGIELGPGDRLALLDYLQSIGADVRGVDKTTGDDKKVTKAEYNDFLQTQTAQEPLDFIYGRLSIYAFDWGKAPVDLNAREAKLRARYEPLNRALKEGGILVIVRYKGEEIGGEGARALNAEQMSDNELSKLGFEQVPGQREVGRIAPMVVTVLRKSGPAISPALVISEKIEKKEIKAKLDAIRQMLLSGIEEHGYDAKIKNGVDQIFHELSLNARLARARNIVMAEKGKEAYEAMAGVEELSPEDKALEERALKQGEAETVIYVDIEVNPQHIKISMKNLNGNKEHEARLADKVKNGADLSAPGYGTGESLIHGSGGGIGIARDMVKKRGGTFELKAVDDWVVAEVEIPAVKAPANADDKIVQVASELVGYGIDISGPARLSDAKLAELVDLYKKNNNLDSNFDVNSLIKTLKSLLAKWSDLRGKGTRFVTTVTVFDEKDGKEHSVYVIAIDGKRYILTVGYTGTFSAAGIVEQGPTPVAVNIEKAGARDSLPMQVAAANTAQGDVQGGVADWIVLPGNPQFISTLYAKIFANRKQMARLYDKNSDTNVRDYLYQGDYGEEEFTHNMENTITKIAAEMRDSKYEDKEPRAIIYAPAKAYRVDAEGNPAKTGYDIALELLDKLAPDLRSGFVVIKEAIPPDGVIHEAIHVDLGRELLNYKRQADKGRFTTEESKRLVEHIRTVTKTDSIPVDKRDDEILADLLLGKIRLEVIRPVDWDKWDKEQKAYIALRQAA